MHSNQKRAGQFITTFGLTVMLCIFLLSPQLLGAETVNPAEEGTSFLFVYPDDHEENSTDVPNNQEMSPPTGDNHISPKSLLFFSIIFLCATILCFRQKNQYYVLKK